MISKKWYIKLDVQKQYDNELITMIKQDIYSNELYISLFNNGRLVKFDDVTHISVVVDKSDSTKVIGSGEIIRDGLIKYTVDHQAIAALGIATVTLKIHTLESVMATAIFNINIIADPYAGTDTSIESISEYTVLQDLINKHTLYVEAENSRAVAELLRVNAETNRTEAEGIRANNEIDRVGKEETRSVNEIARISNETTRSENENTRVANELVRDIAEGLRIAQEEARELAEGLRDSAYIEAENAREQQYYNFESIRDNYYTNAESNRNTLYNQAENTRELSEAARVTEESNRVTAETSRVIAEGNRSTNEAARVLAETERETNYTHKINEFVAETERVEAEYPARLTGVENDLTEHKLDYMPHRIQDLKNKKNYNFGFQISAEGNPQIIYEEVI